MLGFVGSIAEKHVDYVDRYEIMIIYFIFVIFDFWCPLLGGVRYRGETNRKVLLDGQMQ